MAKRSCFLLVLVTVLTTMLWIGNCQETCKEPMEYSTCVPPCRRTCDDVAKLLDDKPCPTNCSAGCFCKPGYVLNYNQCMPEKNCTCPENAEYSCRKCERTCEDVTRIGRPPKICPMICILGCECKQGYVLEAGKCIPEAQCHCQKNSEFVEKGTCLQTCEDVASMTPYACTNPGKPGCYCKQEYAMKGTECIPQKECSCKKNAKYSDCNTACPLTCSNYRAPTEPCPKKCEKGCDCEKGYVKSATGECVKPEQCP
ncbi:mucin-6-like [Lissotriton helveticus]